MRLILAMWWAASVPAIPSGQEDPVDVLARLRDEVLRHARRIPNHTCVETIEREEYEPVLGRIGKSCDALLARRRQSDFPRHLRLEVSDRIRLDVGLARAGEMYSWPGAREFSEGHVYQFVPQGAMGTGPFGALLLAVFEARNPHFLYEGETTAGGRRLMRYSFLMHEEDSLYRVEVGGSAIVTGFTASLLVDPGTAELVQLSVRTGELPGVTTMCEADTTLDYGKVPLGGVDYMMPVATRQRFIGRDGAESENRISFDSCREFRGESTVEFGAAGRAVSPDPAPVPVGLHLPPAHRVIIEMASAIEIPTAAAGDRIEGRLVDAVGDLPAGARVEGRLMEVRAHHVKPVNVAVALRWETVEFDGRKAPLALKPHHRDGMLIAEKVLQVSMGTRIERTFSDPGQYDSYRFPGQTRVVPAGFRTEWLTSEK
jgi:hypothetical protein